MEFSLLFFNHNWGWENLQNFIFPFCHIKDLEIQLRKMSDNLSILKNIGEESGNVWKMSDNLSILKNIGEESPI